MEAPTCKTCPLFVRDSNQMNAGQCHGDVPYVVQIVQPAQRLAGIGQQAVQIQLQPAWRPVEASSIGCRHHPAIAAVLADAADEMREQLRRNRMIVAAPAPSEN